MSPGRRRSVLLVGANNRRAAAQRAGKVFTLLQPAERRPGASGTEYCAGGKLSARPSRTHRLDHPADGPPALCAAEVCFEPVPFILVVSDGHVHTRATVPAAAHVKRHAASLQHHCENAVLISYHFRRRVTADEPIPPPVLKLLAGLRSVFELEVLLLVRDVPDQEWAPAALGSMLDADADRVRAALSHLARMGVVERLYGGESLCFRYDSGSPSAPNVESLALLYAKRRRALVSLLEAHTTSALQQFSDAFRLRKDR